MLNWENDEDLVTLFDKCRNSTKSEDFAVLILSDFLNSETGDYDIICNLFPTKEYRDELNRVRVFNLSEDIKFKKPEVAIPTYLVEYIITTMQQNQLPPKDIYVVSNFGDTKKIVRDQISKKRARKDHGLNLIRVLLLKTHNLITVNVADNHPYKRTSFEIYKLKRQQQTNRQEQSSKLKTDIDLTAKI